jgi:DNA polymerase-3 subunit alpha
LAVLEQAQAAGQKLQQDALIGQSSIFDLDGSPAAGAPLAPGLGRPSHPAIPSEEFDQAELLAAEKEAIGLFVSAHPLKPLREVLRARVDCPIAALEERRDKETVTVGGIITETKRIRTRAGDHMMFATLDDLAGSVEMLVFGKALAEHDRAAGRSPIAGPEQRAPEAALTVDAVVLVKGRVDHKEAGKTCLVVQSVQLFTPSEQEIERARAEAAASTDAASAEPVHLRVDAAELTHGAIDDLKHAIGDYPGPAEVVLDIGTSAGTRRLRLGKEYRVRPTPTLLAELEHALSPPVTNAATG